MVLVLVAAAWFMFPEMLNNIFHKEVTELVLGEESATSESDSEIPHDLGAEGTAAEVEKPPKAVPVETPGNREPVSAVRPSGKQYYVVAGCFLELKNAENYVQTLRDNGYDASVFGMRKNLHTVCFNSHTSKQAAIEELYRIQDSYDPHVWVLYY